MKSFSAMPTKLHNGIQMFYNIGRVNRYARSADVVIIHRSPVDYIAFVPKSDEWPVEMEADGIRPFDHDYRDEVDAIFKEIYRKGRLHVLPENNGPRLVELWGPRQQRRDQLQAAIDDLKLGDKAIPWTTVSPSRW
jgi:hypothetical protein